MNNTNVNLYYYYRNYVSILPISCHGYHKFEILGYLKKKQQNKNYLELIRTFKKGCHWLICSNVGLFDQDICIISCNKNSYLSQHKTCFFYFTYSHFKSPHIRFSILHYILLKYSFFLIFKNYFSFFTHNKLHFIIWAWLAKM